MTLQSNDNNNRDEYSFQDINSDQTFYLDIDRNNEPIKLGDGTFGVVFAASNSKKDELAVKILYEYSAPGISNENSESIENIESTPNVIRKRFENELNSTRQILDDSKDKKLTRVIKIVGSTNKFKESELYQQLQKKFRSLKLSNYALVTERYNSTLKNLLEEGIEKFTSPQYPQSEIEPFNSREELEEKISDNEKKIYELKGYDILKRMTFEDRIATILPYLLDIAQGLETIHKANLCHLDLKPANIFVREDGFTVQSVIGDLGFLYPGEQPAKFEALPVANLQLPLGTRHYRSPEQKDYFDICDVEVQVCNSNSKENQKENYDVNLITYDPKLRDTIIENGDYIVFSKNKKTYYIKSIFVDNSSENSPIHIALNTKINELSNDKKTQVILYKKQTQRTDLFGFGAIVYDLLTCGESPERFYENIRVIYDKKGKNVEDIMDDYFKVSNFQSSEPSLVQVFEPFKDKTSSSYAPSEIIKIILQCILYKADNTFYSLSKASNSKYEQEKTVGILLENLLNLTDYRGGKYKVKDKENPLFRRTLISTGHPSNDNFLKTIKNIQNLKKDKLWERFLKGLWYLKQISKLVDKLLLNSNFSFSELLPTNFAITETITESNVLNLKFNLYKTKESYERDLRSDFVYTKITRDIGNPFVPNYLAFIRRKIRLIKDENKNNITYQFLDSSPYGDIVGKDDWIILKLKNNNLLFQVEEVDQTSNTIKSKLISENKEARDSKERISSNEEAKDIIEYTPSNEDRVNNLSFQTEEVDQIPNIMKSKLTSENQETKDIKEYISSEEEGVYYKYIDPCVYYLNMIGIYIYQIFFVGIDNHTQSKPYITDIVNNEVNKIKIKNLNNEIKITIKENSKQKKTSILFFQKGESDSDNFEKTLEKIVSIYLKLTFHESRDSYYRKANNPKSRIYLLLDDIDELDKTIKKATGGINTRNYPEEKSIPILKPELENILKPFNEMTLDLIKVEEVTRELERRQDKLHNSLNS